MAPWDICKELDRFTKLRPSRQLKSEGFNKWIDLDGMIRRLEGPSGVCSARCVNPSRLKTLSSPLLVFRKISKFAFQVLRRTVLQFGSI